MDSTSTVGSSVESTPQRTTPRPDFDNQLGKIDETLGGTLQSNQNRMTGTFRIEHKAVQGSSSSHKKVSARRSGKAVNLSSMQLSVQSLSASLEPNSKSPNPKGDYTSTTLAMRIGNSIVQVANGMSC